MNQKYAYEMTYKELVALDADVIDHTGRMIRRSDDPRQRWSMWQKDVQHSSRLGLVSRDVMDYFQATKHLSRPPREGDIAILTKEPLPKSIIIERSDMPRFTWSPSKLMTFETCPQKFAAESWYRTVPYEETEATIWGVRVHKAAEDHLNGCDVTDPEAFYVVKPYLNLLDRLPGERLVEYRIGLGADWKPCGWDEAEARMIVDLAIKDGTTLKVFDWKTGKMKDDVTQMQIYAYALFITFPEVEFIDCKYIWLKEKKSTGFAVAKKDILPIAKDIRERVKRLRTACEFENFPMRKSGLCKRYCGAVDCPYNGRGR
jgi:hypothetical protein